MECFFLIYCVGINEFLKLNGGVCIEIGLDWDDVHFLIQSVPVWKSDENNSNSEKHYCIRNI